jgi:hypothetical protein
LLDPVVLHCKALCPIAVLKDPELLDKAKSPIAMLLDPDVFLFKAARPIAVL